MAGPTYLLQMLVFVYIARAMARLPFEDRTGVIVDFLRIGGWTATLQAVILVLTVLVDWQVLTDYKDWDTVLSVLWFLYFAGLFCVG